ncbi:hypothetical protein [Paenibacillus daejeonensis]|uniref:hypothetical protein n=1 Tax=Paenibacillus daejeonensis TaxID=135193 RepID=UPI000377DC90|nr:hypothetical protein [Paenibacillus daejeonensis]
MERKLKERLLEESKYDPGDKDEIWAKLDAHLDHEPQPAPPSQQEDQPTLQKRRAKLMKKIKITTGVAAAAIAVGVFFSLPAGTAFMNEIQGWFAPEKQVQVEVEGQKEETQQELHQDEESRYVIYYDVDRYKLIEGEHQDMITTKEPLPDMYPEVSLTIDQALDVSPAQVAAQVAEQLQSEFAEVSAPEQIQEPVEGYVVHAIDGNEWDSPVTRVYLVDNGKSGTFVLQAKYFLEAAEGHGARFEQMLGEFQVLPE